MRVPIAGVSKLAIIFGVIVGAVLLLAVVTLVFILVRRILQPDSPQTIQANKLSVNISLNSKSSQSQPKKQSADNKKCCALTSPCSRLGPPSLMDPRFGDKDSQLLLNFDVGIPTSSDLDADVPDCSTAPKALPSPSSVMAAKLLNPKTVGVATGLHLKTRPCSAGGMQTRSIKFLSPMPIKEKRSSSNTNGSARPQSKPLSCIRPKDSKQATAK